MPAGSRVICLSNLILEVELGIDAASQQETSGVRSGVVGQTKLVCSKHNTKHTQRVRIDPCTLRIRLERRPPRLLGPREATASAFQLEPTESVSLL